MKNKGKLVYFGASGCGDAYCKNTGIVPDIFVDNDDKKWGTFFNGVKVMNPSILSKIKIKKLVVTTSFLEAVYPQILKMGIKESLIHVPSKAMWSNKIFENLQIRIQAANMLYKIMTAFEDKSSLVAVGGTALGFVRESDFISWDDDIDLFSPLKFKTTLIDALNQWNYSFEEKPESIMQALVFWMPLENDVKIPVSVDFFESSGNFFLDTFEDYTWEWPVEMFTNCSQINIHGNSMNVPNPPEEYLEKVYGPEWSKPNPNFGYADYTGNKKLDM